MDVGAVPRSAERQRVVVSLLHFSAHKRFFFKVLIATSVNKNKKLNFSDVFRNVNYIGSRFNNTHINYYT